MRPAILAIALLFLLACRKNDDNTYQCSSEHISQGYQLPNKTLIPINTANFWIYADSTFDPQTGLFATETATQVSIAHVYHLKDNITTNLPNCCRL